MSEQMSEQPLEKTPVTDSATSDSAAAYSAAKEASAATGSKDAADSASGKKQMNMLQAINNALDIAMAANPRVVLFGEDELKEAKVKIKDMAAKEETLVDLARVVEELQARLPGAGARVVAA